MTQIVPRWVILLPVVFLLAAPWPARAQVSVAAAVNVASFLRPELPNGKLAQGVMFTLFGEGMGPAELVEAGPFPLPRELASTSVEVTVGGTSVACIMIFTRADRVAAILPSTVPVGPGTLTVTFNGVTSAPLDIEVVAHGFGTFALNQGGSGPGILTDPLAPVQRVNGLFESANPGSIWDIWGTGVGAVAVDEATGPAPGDLTHINVQVIVGGKPAQVLYRGRSGCCAGIDQIRIVIPEGVEGCSVPLVVIIEGAPSNFTSMSIAPEGAVCSDPNGASAEELEMLRSEGEIRSGQAILGRIWIESNIPGDDSVQRSDNASAAFVGIDSAQSLQARNAAPTIGSCVVNQIPGAPAVEITGLDAGMVSLSGPVGSFDLLQFVTGQHILSFVPGSPDLPGVVNDGTLLEAGQYTHTGTGGADVGAFNVRMDLPTPIDWTNRTALDTVNLNQPLVINWTNGTPGTFVQIIGTSAFARGPNGLVGAQFQCRVDATAGTFVVPGEVVASLPVSIDNAGAPGGQLLVGAVGFGERFQTNGIAYGLSFFADVFLKNVNYR